METFTRETYGIMVYQEQIMQIASEMAGFTMGEADTLRRAMGKKDRDLMAQQRQKFIAGCKERGTAAAKAERVWELMEKFAGYGFNKCLAADTWVEMGDGSRKPITAVREGEIVTLNLQAKGVRIVPEGSRSNEDAPSHRVYVGRAEIGAAWSKRSNEGRDYLSLKLDDPSFTAPIFANLFDDEDGEGFSLIWSRSRKKNGE